ncbi:hypothetical protein [Nostoc sp. CALU 546]
MADIFYDHGQEFIKFRNGKEILSKSQSFAKERSLSRHSVEVSSK